MKFNPIFIFIVIFFTYHSDSYSQPSSNFYSIAKNYSFKKNKLLEKIYDNTKCINFYKNNKKKSIGLFCSSSDPAFLNDYGLKFSFLQDSPTSEKIIKIEVSTGNSIYEMHPANLKNKTLYTTDVDCDTENGSIYRSNSTCNIGYMEKDGYFLYSNFILKIDTKNINPINSEEIIKIWNSFDPSKFHE